MHYVYGDTLMIASNAGTYQLPESERQHFKKPLGTLFRHKEDIREYLNWLKEHKKSKIIAVGDATTRVLLREGLYPDIAIIDGLEKREKTEPIDIDTFKVFEAKNPAAHITLEAWECINTAMKIDDIKIIIKIRGEEDLTVLPVILEAPEGSIVLYGQPNEGLVVVEDNKDKKNEVKELLKKMVRIDGI